MIALWTTKGGSGVSVTTAVLAMALARRGRRPMVVDVPGDQAAIFATDAPMGPGFGEWLSTATADGAALARLSSDAGPVDLVHPGRLTTLADPRRRLKALDDDCLLDAGVIKSSGDAAAAVVEGCSTSLLVLRPCYLAVRRAAATGVKSDGIVLVREPGRSLSSSDLEDVLQLPVVLELDLDVALARAVDAGRLTHKSLRIPKAVERFVSSQNNGDARRAG